ncbi:MAG: 5'/3'-nucleotidase SurE, partial [Bacteroidaceae bacterium]|nr:5'/3'-nucleotidase SurE [Bacteroidaceae bacterium]
HAKGINSLVDMLADMADIVVCAPEAARSGFACAFTVTDPLRLKLRREREGMQMWSCTGTPVDCVKLALDQLLDGRRPDMVIGGINHGDNASVNVHYSGTMGAVLEACMKGLPAVGYSLRTFKQQCNFVPFDRVILQVAEHVLLKGLPQDVCLNVNFPEVDRLEGARVTRMCRGYWSSEWMPAQHPHGAEFYWLTGHFDNLEPEATDTDNWALDHGYASITPIQLDMTACRAMAELSAALTSDDSSTN